MINTRDGVMNGLENSRKRGKWTKIFDEKSMKTKSLLTLVRGINLSEINIIQRSEICQSYWDRQGL